MTITKLTLAAGLAIRCFAAAIWSEVSAFGFVAIAAAAADGFDDEGAPSTEELFREDVIAAAALEAVLESETTVDML